jgi:hypothetical protein
MRIDGIWGLKVEDNDFMACKNLQDAYNRAIKIKNANKR